MKTVRVDPKRTTLRRVLREAKEGEVVFLTIGEDIRFALVRADESDREVCALRSNADFMAHLSDLEARAKTRPRRTLKQVRERFNA